MLLCYLSFTDTKQDRQSRTQAKSRTTARWPKSRIALQTALDVFGRFAKQDRALRIAMGFWMLFRCFDRTRQTEQAGRKLRARLRLSGQSQG